MKRSTKSIAVAVVAIAAILIVCAAAVLYHATAPLAQREDKTVYTPKENVVIQASTFNGNVEIQSTSGSQIEVIYSVTAPDGYLPDVKTSTNKTEGDNFTTLVTSAILQINQANNYKANLLINLPSTSKYNLTLTTENGNIIKQQLNNTKVVATAGNGNIDIKDDGNSGEIEAMTYNGNIKVSLTEGTLFQVAASVGNGKITHQGITLDSDTESATRLKGATPSGAGNLNITLLTANGDITLEYSS